MVSSGPGVSTPRRCASHTPNGPIDADASAAISILRGVLGTIIADSRMTIESPDRCPIMAHGRVGGPRLEQGDVGRIEQHQPQAGVRLVLRRAARVAHPREGGDRRHDAARFDEQRRPASPARRRQREDDRVHQQPDRPQEAGDEREDGQPLNLLGEDVVGQAGITGAARRGRTSGSDAPPAGDGPGDRPATGRRRAPPSARSPSGRCSRPSC